MRIHLWICIIISVCSHYAPAVMHPISAVSRTDRVLPRLSCSNITPGISLGQPQAGIPTKRFYRYDQTILEAAQHYKIDPFFIKAILVIESGLNPAAVSKANARGIAQFMRATAKTLGIVDRHDPDASIWGCAALVKKLGDRFDGNMCLVAAAYNAGPQALIRAGRELTRMRRETQHYVPSVMATWRNMYSHSTSANKNIRP